MNGFSYTTFLEMLKRGLRFIAISLLVLNNSRTHCHATSLFAAGIGLPRTRHKAMTAVHNKFSESSVLAELKETIRKQAIEIEKLKKSQIVEQTSISPHTATSTAHGGGPIDDGATYMTKSFLQVAYQRVGWLSLFLVSLSFTAIIVNGFEHTLSRQIELAFFMPLLAGHGGNTGGQSVGTILSALSSHDLSLRDAPKVILKEACSGLTVGIFLGTILAFISYFFMGISIHVSTCLCCTLPLISLIASTLGSTIPFLCVMMNLDPSVIAAPAMTSFVDVTGLLSYFLIANQVFRLFGLEL